MEVQHVAVTTPTGLSMMQFVIDDGYTRREPTDENIKSEVFRVFGEGTTYRVVDISEVPTNRDFRNAWADIDGVITFDMVKARDIHRDKMRAVRAPLLASLDLQYMRADEENNVELKAEIVLKKQALRAITDRPEIEQSQSIEELAAFWPDILETV